MLLGHAHNQLLVLLGATRSATRLALRAAITLLGDQSLVPTQECIGRRNRGDLLQALAPKRVGKGRETAALGIRQAQPAAATLSFEDTIVFDQVGDDLVLVPLQLAGNQGEEHVKDHGVSSGWRQRQSGCVQYTPNLRHFNGVTTAEIFNQTGVA